MNCSHLGEGETYEHFLKLDTVFSCFGAWLLFCMQYLRYASIPISIPVHPHTPPSPTHTLVHLLLISFSPSVSLTWLVLIPRLFELFCHNFHYSYCSDHHSISTANNDMNKDTWENHYHLIIMNDDDNETSMIITIILLIMIIMMAD